MFTEVELMLKVYVPWWKPTVITYKFCTACCCNKSCLSMLRVVVTYRTPLACIKTLPAAKILFKIFWWPKYCNSPISSQEPYSCIDDIVFFFAYYRMQLNMCTPNPKKIKVTRYMCHLSWSNKITLLNMPSQKKSKIINETISSSWR